MKARLRFTVAALGFTLVGCGVQPTGVVDAGEPATGLTTGVRLYYASVSGLRGVPVLDREINAVQDVIKFLTQGPSPAEQRDGLTTLVQDIGGYTVTAQGTRVTLHLEKAYAQTGLDLGTGQLVCTLARAQAVLEPNVRTDDVEVTLKPSGSAALGPFRCAEFRSG